MPEINNYSFSNAVFNIQEGTVINDQVTSAIITISPLSGHTVTASDFSLDPSFSNAYVQSVTFTQSGTNVICTTTFLPTVTMPSANVTIPLCIVGQGVVNEITIGGTVTAVVGADVTGDSSETDTTYSNSGNVGNNELLFTRTYNAATGFAWANNGLPSINVTQGNQSNYNIIQTPIFDSQNRLTNITYDVNYIYPSADISGDHIDIVVPKTNLIYNPLPKITGYTFNTSVLGNDAEIRSLVVLGTPSTTFSATLNDGTTTTTIINNQPLDANGRFEQDVSFPALTKGQPNRLYTIELTGSNVANIPLPNPFTVSQLNEVQIIVGKVNNVPTPVSGWPSTDPRTEIAALTQNPFTNLTQSSGIWLIKLDYNLSPYTVTGTFTVIKQIETSDFTNTDEIITAANGNQTNVTSLTLDSTAGIVVGDKIALLDELAPYESTVSGVNTSTALTISPAITVLDNQQINFYRDNGNKIEVFNSNVTLVNSSTVNLKCDIAIVNVGDAGITFDLDLSNIISYTP